MEGNKFTLSFAEGFFTQPYKTPLTGKVKRRNYSKLKRKGVYFIKEHGIIVYIGMSQSCVVEALYRHFYYYNDTHKRPRHYYNVLDTDKYSVFIIETTKEEAPALEKALILSLNPRDNRQRYQAYLDELSVNNIRKKQEDNYITGNEDTEDLPF